ncbi:unnamed protein product [Brachionus calyciflorus]|uniref:Uncharacterized protein n=1 Tax=Brachionus calyciflorus TaxID=104777 RepID=A0A813LYZ1_9BILA|nr:unnamed protein product [Brachionus calyciflorus]
MDETSIYLDFPTNYTYETKGSKRVKGVTCCGEKTRISAAVTGTAIGEKLPLMILVLRKTDIPNYQVPENLNTPKPTETTPTTPQTQSNSTIFIQKIPPAQSNETLRNANIREAKKRGRPILSLEEKIRRAEERKTKNR